jgi:tetratricopeptide (TPR) repeat protein
MWYKTPYRLVETKNKINFLSLLTVLFLGPSFSAFATYESSDAEVANFDMQDSHSNLKLARIEQSKGKLTEAIFALERAIAIEPNNIEAQLLLGEIYAQLGEKDSAEKQFTRVINAKNELSASAQIALNNLKYVRTWSHKAVVGYRLGSNDNINSGLDNTSIFIPSVGSALILPDSSNERTETTQTLYTSGNLRYQHTDTLAYVFKGSLAKNNDDYFNQSYVGINVGARLNYKNYQRSFQLIQNYFDYDNFDEISSLRFNYEYLQKLTGKNYFKASVDLQALDYKTQDINDDRRLILRGQYRYVVSPTLSLKPELVMTRDIKTVSSFEHLDYDSYGSKITLYKQLNQALNVKLGLDYIANNYDGQDTLFIRERSDKRMNFSAMLLWHVAQATTFSVAYQHTDNDSNISLYDFDKNVFFIELAKTF